MQDVRRQSHASHHSSSDFHLPVSIAPDDRTSRSLAIEVIIALPELVKVRRHRPFSSTC
jgi:hypothetical protein